MNLEIERKEKEEGQKKRSARSLFLLLLRSSSLPPPICETETSSSVSPVQSLPLVDPKKRCTREERLCREEGAGGGEGEGKMGVGS